MSAHKKLWKAAEPAPAEFVEQFCTDMVPHLTEAAPLQHAALLAHLLYQREMTTAEAVTAFFRSSYKDDLHDPFLMKGMPEASNRIAKAIRAGEPIAVYGDFDTDGVSAVTLLMQVIRAMGGNIAPYIPHREREGYGLNKSAIDALAEQGTRLLITVDCGISNVEEVAHARAVGLDVIVTDHHTPPPILPAALAVVNPKQPGCPYPFKQLVGVGIAFKLVQALVKRGLHLPLRGRDMLDVVALGTVADMGPLNGENRVLVKFGIQALRETQRPGLLALTPGGWPFAATHRC
ncbi:MAG: single-stranded-DNA-specific exonuclease RecJ, partial [Chloroflexaceae bacterium]|nr:single-stranded-DNA-specific exonuclease RecJ [Chloroflexaceae bacterium]